MPRPSRNLDQALLAAGRKLLAARGCAGLSIREVAETAGVNPGMFHYHFRTREAFLRAVLQQVYEEMFARLTFEVAHDAGLEENLRRALRVLAHFLRDNRPFLSRLFGDALGGDPIAREFMAANGPRHIGVVRELVAKGQAAGVFRPLAPPQAIAFCASTVAMPILVGGAIVESGALAKPAAKGLAAALISDAAIDERIELAIAGLRAIPNPGKSTARRTTPRQK